MRKLILSILSILPVLGFLRPAAAQEGGKGNLYGLETGAFPVMTATLDVYDQNGIFITDLHAEDVTLLEDGQNIPVDSLLDSQPGVRFVVAVDPGPYFAYRDANAVTRFDKVVAALKTWGELHPDTLGDDISLVPAGGEPALHLAGTGAFLEALASYQPDLSKLVPSPVTLATAMDIVSGQSPTPGMKSVVLYITSLPEAASIPILQNLAQRAVQANILIHVWIIAPLDLSFTTRAASLKDLALQTGGQAFLFSGNEEFPNLEGLLAARRHAYQITYTSSIRTSGSHMLAANVGVAGAAISTELSYNLDVQPPNPILTGLPVQIVRRAPDEKTTDPVAFNPRQQGVEIIVEFPDGRKRSLVRTTLSVDGILADENTSPPFDVFEWDLSSYATSGTHSLVVEAVDSLGLSRQSLGIPVLVTVVQPQTGLLPWLSRNSTWVAGVAILLAGAGLALTLVRRLAGKQVPAGRGAGAKTIPGLQPAKTGQTQHRIRLPWDHSTRLSDAFLLRLKEDGEPILDTPIPILRPEMTFGANPVEAMHLLNDPSVSPLHARISEKEGKYTLSDERSTAGTWVNYEPVTSPRLLQHGDRINFGRSAYRFMLSKPPQHPAPRLVPIQKRDPTTRGN